jgi:Flp pilus assembly protein TadD
MKSFLPSALAVLALAGLSACARPLAAGALSAGLRAARADDWDAASRHWSEAVRRDPRSAAAHNNLAVACEKRGDWDGARREYEEALRLAPGHLVIQENFKSFKARLEAARGKGP